jgi:hypothetical protein
MIDRAIAYCGALPTAWGGDLLSIAGLVALASAYAFLILLTGASGPIAGRVASLASRVMLGAALVSPLFYLGIAFL